MPEKTLPFYWSVKLEKKTGINCQFYIKNTELAII